MGKSELLGLKTPRPRVATGSRDREREASLETQGVRVRFLPRFWTKKTRGKWGPVGSCVGWGHPGNFKHSEAGLKQRWSVAQSCPTLCDPRDYSPPGSSVHGISRGKSTGAGWHFLLQGIFMTQVSDPCLLHWQADSLLLSSQESPRSRVGHIKCLLIRGELVFISLIPQVIVLRNLR